MAVDINGIINGINTLAPGGAGVPVLQGQIDGLALENIRNYFGTRCYTDSAKQAYCKEGAVKIWHEIEKKALTANDPDKISLYRNLVEKVEEITLGAISGHSFGVPQDQKLTISDKRKEEMTLALESAKESLASAEKQFSFNRVFGPKADINGYDLLGGAPGAVAVPGFALVQRANSLEALKPFEKELAEAKAQVAILKNEGTHLPRKARAKEADALLAEKEILRRKIFLQRPEVIGFGAKALGPSFDLGTKTFVELEALEKSLKTFEDAVKAAKKVSLCLSDQEKTNLDAEIALAKAAIETRRTAINLIRDQMKNRLQNYFIPEGDVLAARTDAIRDALIADMNALEPGYFFAGKQEGPYTEKEIGESEVMKAHYQQEIRGLCNTDNRAFAQRGAAPVVAAGKKPVYEELLQEAKPKPGLPEAGVFAVSGIALPAALYFSGIVTSLASLGFAGAGIGLATASAVHYYRDGALASFLTRSR